MKLFKYSYVGLQGFNYYVLRGCVLAESEPKALNTVEERYAELIDRDKKHSIIINEVEGNLCEIILETQDELDEIRRMKAR